MEESYLEVNLENVSYNIKQIQKVAGKDKILIPVIKADAYGLGAVALKDVLKENDINIVAVAVIKEAIELRKNGFDMQILVLNEILKEEAEQVVDNDLTVGISKYEVAETLNKIALSENKKCKVHIKIDSGMGRVGIQPNEVIDFASKVNKLSNIIIDGIYTHLSSADEFDDDSIAYTKMQLDVFAEQVDKIKNLGITPKFIHACASAGILKYNDKRFNAVRPGIILYGYMPSEDIVKFDTIKLKPTTELKSKITFIKDLPQGKSISYSRTYVTSKDTKIATVGLGYADGIRRNLSNKQEVLINGKLVPIIGNICMDNFMVDVSSLPNVKVGGEVLLWDNKNITLEELANKCNTINYEILCGISKRVSRKYVK